MRCTGWLGVRRYCRQDDVAISPASPIIEWVGIGVFGLLLGCVLLGLCMVFGQGTPLPLEAICFRG